VLCRQLDLFSEALVAIDGSKFKAVNNRDNNFTDAKMKRRMAAINESIERYLTSMDTADRTEVGSCQLGERHAGAMGPHYRQSCGRRWLIEVPMRASRLLA